MDHETAATTRRESASSPSPNSPKPTVNGCSRRRGVAAAASPSLPASSSRNQISRLAPACHPRPSAAACRPTVAASTDRGLLTMKRATTCTTIEDSAGLEMDDGADPAVRMTVIPTPNQSCRISASVCRLVPTACPSSPPDLASLPQKDPSRTRWFPSLHHGLQVGRTTAHR